MFSEGMTAFQRSCRPRGKCARVEAAEFPNNSFMTSIMDSGKNSRVSRKLKKRQYTRWCFSAIYAELNEVHIYMRALIMNLTSTMTNCSTDNHMLLNVKYYSTLHVAWGKEKQRNNCHYGNFDTNSSRLYKVTRESKENVDPSLLSWSNIFPCEGAASHSGGCASGETGWHWQTGSWTFQAIKMCLFPQTSCSLHFFCTFQHLHSKQDTNN